MPDALPGRPAEESQPAFANGHHASPTAAPPPPGRLRGQLPPLQISAALGRWALGLALAGGALLVLLGASFAGLLVRYGPAAWSIDVMILLACVPVAIAVVWIVRRAVAGAAADFVRGVCATPLLEILPPPRPQAFASPGATLRSAGLLPLVATLAVVGCLVLAADGWAQTTNVAALVVGAGAVTSGGLAMVAALLLTLSGCLRQAGQAVMAREREVGAHFYAYTVAAPEAAGSQADGRTSVATGICAVPAPL